MKLTQEQIKELAETTSRGKSNSHRIDTLEQQNTIMHDMNTNIALIAKQTIYIEKDVQDLTMDVDVLKSKGAKRWDMIIDKSIAVIVGAAIGAIMANIIM